MGVDEGGLAVVQAGTVAATASAAAAAVALTPAVSAEALAGAASLTIISTAVVTQNTG